MKDNIELGVQARDKVTGFEGIVTAKIEYLTGCTQFCVTPKVKDGKIESNEYFDETRLEVTGAGINPEEVADENDPGGPNRDCPK